MKGYEIQILKILNPYLEEGKPHDGRISHEVKEIRERKRVLREIGERRMSHGLKPSHHDSTQIFAQYYNHFYREDDSQNISIAI